MRMRRLSAVGLAVLAIVAGACSRSTPPTQTTTSAQPQPAAPAPVAAAPDDSGRPKIVALGDSLTAGYGLLESQAYPALLQQKLEGDGYGWEVVNAGVSGDTSAAGRARLEWALQQQNVRLLILELGANDGLRGLPVDQMKKNLAAIIETAQARQIAVLLVGMEAPPNYGPEYAAAFRQVYRDLARQYKVPFVPFMLDRVAGISSLNQADGIHPNIEGTQIVADTLWRALRPMVDAANAS
jgi:acyl-CoA thioesterase-1